MNLFEHPLALMYAVGHRHLDRYVVSPVLRAADAEPLVQLPLRPPRRPHLPRHLHLARPTDWLVTASVAVCQAEAEDGQIPCLERPTEQLRVDRRRAIDGRDNRTVARPHVRIAAEAARIPLV